MSEVGTSTAWNGAYPEVRIIPTTEQQLRWLCEGIEQALEHLQNDRKTLAINVLKGTLAGKGNCW